MKLKIILWLWLLSATGWGQPLRPADIKLVTDLVQKKMYKDQVPGASVAIVKDGKLVWARGFGYANLEHQVKAKASTAYRTASIAKTITATAVMQLVQQGRLDLDAPVQKYCIHFPKKRWVITTRQLLNHTSGIRHYHQPEQQYPEEFYNKKHYTDMVQPLELFKHDSLLFRPGTRYKYSSYGYNLLGCLLADVQGEHFMTCLQAGIFEKAGMKHTQADNPYSVIADRAAGYKHNKNKQLVHCEFANMTNKLPSGGLITTAPDLARFAAAFMNNKLVNAQIAKAMLMPQKTSKGKTIGYGLGWGLFPGEKWYGETEAFHGGDTPGVSSMLYLLPERKFAVVILMNRRGVTGNTALAATIAKEILRLKKPK